MNRNMGYCKDLVSVIIPVYRVEEYLYRCVDSLLKQTYREFELILVDDGSPDSCGRICDEYVKMDERVKVIHKKNGGLSDARNAGLEIAKGEYVSFIDSDDWVSADYLKKLINTLKETQADICECNVLKTEKLGKYQTIENEVSSVPEVYGTTDALEQLICDNAFRQHVWNKLYRRSVIKNIKFPKGKTNEDEFWTYQVFGNTKKVVKIQEVLYYYFQRPNSIMGTTYSVKRLDAIEAKIQRQRYIEERFPKLEKVARLNLFGSCIYAGQMSIMHLSREQLVTAKRIIGKAVYESRPSFFECIRVDGSNKAWYSLARVFFWETCRVKNILRRGL